jgi:hypothetical protein
MFIAGNVVDDARSVGAKCWSTHATLRSYGALRRRIPESYKHLAPS